MHPHLAVSLEHCPDPRLADLLAAAGEAALAAGAVLRRLYDTPVAISRKGRIDLVTEADVAAEKAILEILGRRHPEVAVLAEESANTWTTPPDGPVWIIDPLDGTTNFAHAFPWFAVSIGYCEGGIGRLGVIYNPIQEEFFCGCRGGGAWLNGRRLAVSGIADLEQAILATGFPYAIRDHADQVVGLLKAMLLRVQGIRRPGAAALDLAYVACGRLDGFWEINLKPWDTAAGVLILEEAGGLISDFAGLPHSHFRPEIVASNRLLHEQMLAVIREQKR